MTRRSNTKSTNKVRRKKPSNASMLLGLVLALLIGLVYHVVTRQSPILPGSVEQELGGIRIEGVGGDPDLNRQKNRFTTPATLEDVAPSQIAALRDDLLLASGRKRRASWPPDTKNYLGSMEQRGMRVTGYLIAAKQSEPESCNGFIDSLRDYHLWIGDSASASKPTSLVIEMTPRWKAIHPEWRLRYLNALARQHAKIRVTGWLMWDEEHPNEVGHSRASCWEIHPITTFEIWSSGAWREISTDLALE